MTQHNDYTKQMKNQIYYGDNLDVLRNHIATESVDLCYIDPPFNSKRNYNQIYNNIGIEAEYFAYRKDHTTLYSSQK